MSTPRKIPRWVHLPVLAIGVAGVIAATFDGASHTSGVDVYDGAYLMLITWLMASHFERLR